MSRDKDFSEQEIANRRDEVVRRMAATPPQHLRLLIQKRKKLTDRGRGAGNGRVGQQA